MVTSGGSKSGTVTATEEVVLGVSGGSPISTEAVTSQLTVEAGAASAVIGACGTFSVRVKRH